MHRRQLAGVSVLRRRAWCGTTDRSREARSAARCDRIQATLKPEANGISVNGATEIQLEENEEEAAESAQLGADMFAWLTEQLGR